LEANIFRDSQKSSAFYEPKGTLTC